MEERGRRGAVRDRRYYFTEPEQREGVLYKLREAEVRCSVLCGEDSVVVMRTLPVWVCLSLSAVVGVVGGLSFWAGCLVA